MIRCRICGEELEAHHEFQPGVMPDGCVCDAMTWDTGVVTSICDSFAAPEGTGPDAYCTICEHERG